MQNSVFLKKFTSKRAYDNEINGYHFFRTYYQNVPSLKYAKTEPFEYVIGYQMLDAKKTEVVTDVLRRGENADMKQFLRYLKHTIQNNSTVRESQGGTQLFYIDRICRMDEKSKGDYARWSALNDLSYVNGTIQPIRNDMMDALCVRAETFSHGVCVPSQGDLHERNLFTDGSIVDFEGAGWNLLATELATFIWHTLFVGNYFGPKYAKWSCSDDKRTFLEKELELDLCMNEVKANIHPTRKHIITDLMSSLRSMSFWEAKIAKDIETALAIRLLTTFPVLEMSKKDRQIAYILSNFFTNNETMNLRSKLELLCR